MRQIVACPAESVSRSRLRPASNSPSRMLDDASAEEVFRLVADVLAEDLEKLRSVIDTVVLSTFEQPVRNRRKARAQVLEVWRDLVTASRLLAQPAPRYRTNHGNLVPRPRHRPIDPEIADLVPLCLPTAAMVEA